MDFLNKVLIVEGRSDKKKVEKVLTDDVLIICTNGTLGVEKMEELILDYELDERDVVLLLDEDDSGHKLRKQLNVELPHAENLFIDKQYRQVEDTPLHVLATVLLSANIEVDPIYLNIRGD